MVNKKIDITHPDNKFIAMWRGYSYLNSGLDWGGNACLLPSKKDIDTQIEKFKAKLWRQQCATSFQYPFAKAHHLQGIIGGLHGYYQATLRDIFPLQKENEFHHDAIHWQQIKQTFFQD